MYLYYTLFQRICVVNRVVKKNLTMSVTAVSDNNNLFVEEELKIVVIGDSSTGKVNTYNIILIIISQFTQTLINLTQYINIY